MDVVVDEGDEPAPLRKPSDTQALIVSGEQQQRAKYDARMSQLPAMG